jgi:chromate reductase, NAD(P)H dehydrogenase (quinone)
MRDIRLLAISGSLRAHSSNTEVLRALTLLVPPRITVTLFDGLATLPAFNPDHDVEGMVPPEPVQSLRAEVEAADAIVISSPEYAHGVPGSLKNALDWLVSVPHVVGKPVALVNASPRSIHAQASLAETLRTMSMALVSELPFVVPLTQRGVTAGAIAADRDLGAPLSDCIDALVVAVGSSRPGVASPPATGSELLTEAR